MTTVQETTKSTSEGWRMKGNEKFVAAQARGINLHLQRDRLGEALRQYHKAYTSAVNDGETASAAKNLGVTNWKMAVIHNSMHNTTFYQVKYFYKEAITYLDIAKITGERCKDYDWQGKIFDHLMTCFDEAFSKGNNFNYSARIALNEEYINCLKETEFKAECYIDLAKLVFQRGINYLQSKDYKTALSAMRECHRPVQEALRLAGGNGTLLKEVDILENDCFVHQCTAESLQAVEIGDKILRDAINTEEIVLMTGIYDAMDWYRQAIVLTREKEVEIEAMAHSRLGVVYHKVIKRKDKAHDYFKRSLDLAATLMPRNFHGQTWFEKATDALKLMQDEQLKQETDEWNKNRVKFIEELEEELKALRKADKEGKLAYLKHIYKTFPPKNKNHKLKEAEVEKVEKDWNQKGMKSLYKSALVHYHPDKQKKHGEKWVTLCEEITKILTRTYECFKGAD